MIEDDEEVIKERVRRYSDKLEKRMEARVAKMAKSNAVIIAKCTYTNGAVFLNAERFKAYHLGDSTIYRKL